MPLFNRNRPSESPQENPQTETQGNKELNERDILSFVETQLSKCKKDAYELQAYLNISYFAGKQWVTMEKTSGKLFEPAAEPWQIRYVANKIQPIVRTELAKVTKNKPIMFVAPATTEDSDIKAARTGEKVMEWLEYTLDLQTKDREAYLWGLTTGISFMKCYWNPAKGLQLEAGTFEGDVDCDVVSLFELKWDTSYSKWDDVPWVSHDKIRTTDYVKQVYGVDVPAESGIMMTNLYESKLQNVNSFYDGVTYKSPENSVVVHEYWEKPCANYPFGRRITTASGKVLFYEEDIGFGTNDTTERELPFFPFMHIQVPGRIIPTCVAEQLIPVQREYNKSRSQIIENKNLMANPMWIMQEGAVEEEITNMPGGIIEYKPGYEKPTMSQPQAMGVDVYKNLEYCDVEFDFISGQHETSHGTTPAGVTSGTAISYLQEQDDTKLAPTVANAMSYKRKYTRYLLKIVQHKYTVPRTLNIVGANKKTETMSFYGAELTSIDVRVQEGSMYQLTRAAKEDYIMKLVQYGILDKITDKEKILKMLELGITDDLYDNYEQDASQAQNEQSKWGQGDMSPIVRDFYNHEVHVSEHNRFRKGDLYTDLSPELQQLVDAHVAEHMEYVMNRMMQQAQAAQPENKGDDMDAIISQLGG